MYKFMSLHMMYCNVLYHITTACHNILQLIKTYYNVLQHTATHHDGVVAQTHPVREHTQEQIRIRAAMSNFMMKLMDGVTDVRRGPGAQTWDTILDGVMDNVLRRTTTYYAYVYVFLCVCVHVCTQVI